MATSSVGHSNHICDTDERGQKQPKSSIFNTPAGIWRGFGTAKASSDCESIRSPRSTLDFRLFSNLRNRLKARSFESLSQLGHKRDWDNNSSTVGLAMINSLAEETNLKDKSETLYIPGRENTVFDSHVKYNSLPKGHVISPLNHKGVSFSGSAMASPSFISSKASNLSAEKKTSSDHCSEIRPSSLPTFLDCCQAYLGEFPRREIELSEDYTCVISHGPNPKKTHIFGDHVWECYMNDMSKEGSSSQGAFGGSSSPCPYPYQKASPGLCYSCKKRQEGKKDIMCTYKCVHGKPLWFNSNLGRRRLSFRLWFPVYLQAFIALLRRFFCANEEWEESNTKDSSLSLSHDSSDLGDFFLVGLPFSSSLSAASDIPSLLYW